MKRRGLVTPPQTQSDRMYYIHSLQPWRDDDDVATLWKPLVRLSLDCLTSNDSSMFIYKWGWLNMVGGFSCKTLYLKHLHCLTSTILTDTLRAHVSKLKQEERWLASSSASNRFLDVQNDITSSTTQLKNMTTLFLALNHGSFPGTWQSKVETFQRETQQFPH